MAQDIYGVDTQVGGAWQLDGAVINIEEADELVITNTNITYNRGVTKFSPLNQRKRYLVMGEANGAITLGMIIGPSKNILAFIKRYADACNVNKNVLTVMPAGIKQCEDDQELIEFICNGCLINSINISVTQVGGGLTMVGAGLGMSFISLQLK